MPRRASFRWYARIVFSSPWCLPATSSASAHPGEHSALRAIAPSRPWQVLFHIFFSTSVHDHAFFQIEVGLRPGCFLDKESPVLCDPHAGCDHLPEQHLSLHFYLGHNQPFMSFRGYPEDQSQCGKENKGDEQKTFRCEV